VAYTVHIYIYITVTKDLAESYSYPNQSFIICWK